MTKLFSIFKETPVLFKERKKNKAKIAKKQNKKKTNRKERNLKCNRCLEFRTTPFSLKKVESIENR